MNQSSPKSVAAPNIGGIMMSRCYDTNDNDDTKLDEEVVANTDPSTTSSTGSIHHVRSLILELAALVGELSSIFLKKVPLDPPLLPRRQQEEDDNGNDNPEEFSISRPATTSTAIAADDDVSRAVGGVLLLLLDLCRALADLHLASAIRRKMELNRKKYPADLCRGKAGKYTQYSAVTGITKESGQSTLVVDLNGDNIDNDINIDAVEDKEASVRDFLASLDGLTQDIGTFARERLWSRYHKPRNLLLALLGELGELAELFQWRGDHDNTLDSLSKEDMDKVGQELADVTIYLIRLADVSHIDLRRQTEALLLSMSTTHED